MRFGLYCLEVEGMTHDLEKRMILARFHYLRNAVNALDCLKLTVSISLYYIDVQAPIATTGMQEL